MKRLFFSTTAMIAVISSTALAQGSASAPDVAGPEAARAVAEVVVTANRSPQPGDRVAQTVAVLDAARIKASQTVLVSDLIARLPGVATTRNGGVGGITSVRIRGAEGDQTVVVVDGVKLNDPSQPGGGYNFANLLTGDIARIEVLKGAQSTLWGSQAIGGVVNIVTADPVGAFEGAAQAEGGSMQTGLVRLAAGGTSDRLTWHLAGGHYATDGVSSFAGGRETDGYDQSSLNGRARLTLSAIASLDFRGTYSRSRNDFDGFPPPFYAFADTAEYNVNKETVLYSGLNLSLFDGRLRNRLATSQTRIDRRSFNPAQTVTQKTFDAVGINRRWEYQGSFAISPGWNTTFGLETETSSLRTAAFSSFSPNPVPDRARAKLEGIYAQTQGEIVGGLTLTAGLRHDHHNAFGDRTLGQLAAAWSLNDGQTVLRASFGQGFKAPTLYQLYSTYGNLGLRPEVAEGWDLGVAQTLGKGQFKLSATAFGRKTENQIDFNSCSFAATTALCFRNGVRRFGYYENLVRTETRGLELDGSGQFGHLGLDGNYSRTQAENVSPGSALKGKDLARRPRDLANLSLTYGWMPTFTTSLDVSWVGQSFDNGANTRKLKAYSLVGLRAAYQLSPEIEVYGRVENALDRRYETTAGYGAPGRGVYLGVRSRF